ncbi:MAG: hypothetical protein LBD89_00925 [Tannerellaceae bacterium]|nr:hypothetical protein [Tannerellaceae bacterium]
MNHAYNKNSGHRTWLRWFASGRSVCKEIPGGGLRY